MKPANKGCRGTGPLEVLVFGKPTRPKGIAPDPTEHEHDQQHSQRNEERRNLEASNQPTIGEANDDGHHHRDEETDFKRGDVGIVERPHHDRRKAEHRTHRQIEFAGGH